MTYRELGAPNLSGGATHPSPHRVGVKPRGRRRSGCEKARVGSDTAAGGLGGQASPPSPAAPNYRPGERAERPAEAATRRGAAAAGTTASDNPPRKASQDARTSAGKQRAQRAPQRERAGARALCARGSYAAGKRTQRRMQDSEP